MRPLPVDVIRKGGALRARVGSEARPGAAPGKCHTIEVSAMGAHCPEGDETLERCFKDLIRFYRHSSVGRQCLSIVHQMNTPLQVLFFQMDLLEQKSQEELDILARLPGEASEKLAALNRYRQGKFSQLRHDLERLRQLNRTLVLQGVHEDAQERLDLDLNQIYRQELEHYQAHPVFRHRVSKEFSFLDDLPPIRGHYIDFSQSFRNLLDNALEAMEGMEHGHLTVITAYQKQRLFVQIGDTGVGIPPQDLPMIFEPCFSTKGGAGGERAGLGLFMVRRLLAPYRAEIRVDSAPGETWVTVALPVG
jgi:two-component system, NtrC family, sensor kinase